MKMKRIFAKDMSEALRIIRQTLGEDAVILSDRKVENGIEIVAAANYDESALQQSTAENSNKSTAVKQKEAEAIAQDRSRKQKLSSVNWEEDPVLVSLQNELTVLRGLLQDQLAGFAWSNLQSQNPIQAKMFRRLKKLGIKNILAKNYSSLVPEMWETEQAWDFVLSMIKSNILTLDNDLVTQGGIIACVGATGVGKTTTVAKLAAQCAMTYGSDSVEILTTDVYRIAAVEQIKTFGKLMNINIHTINSEASLSAAIRSMSSKHLIIVDTPGLCLYDPRLEGLLTMLQAKDKIKKSLVLAANNQDLVQDETIRYYQKYDINNLIVTKVDEATSLGAIISNLIETKIPISYFCSGQKIPDDIGLATTDLIIQKAIALTKQHGINCMEQEIAIEYRNTVAEIND